MDVSENLYQNYNDIDDTIIESVKQEMLPRFKSTIDYDPKDVDLLSNDNWFITRHAMVCNRRVQFTTFIKDLVDKIDTCLKVRRQLGLHQIKPTDFPREFYELRVFDLGFDDVTKKSVIHIRLGNYVDIPEFADQIVRFVVYCASECFKTLAPYQQFVCITDASKFEVEDVNTRTMYSLMTSMDAIGQYMFETTYMFNVVEPLNRVIQFFSNNFNTYRRNTIKMVKTDDYKEKVPLSQWPKSLGGQLEMRPYLPENLNLSNCISLEDFANMHSIPDKNFARASRTLRNVIRSTSIRSSNNG